MQLAGADADVLPLAVRYARILVAGPKAKEMVPGVGGMLNAATVPVGHVFYVPVTQVTPG